MAMVGHLGSSDYKKLAIELAKLMEQAGQLKARDIIRYDTFHTLEISGRYRSGEIPYKITVEAIRANNGKTFTLHIISRDTLKQFCDLLIKWCRLQDDAEIQRATLTISPDDIIIADLDLILQVPEESRDSDVCSCGATGFKKTKTGCDFCDGNA